MRNILLHLTCLRSMNASCSVSPWNPGTGSELANTIKKKKNKNKIAKYTRVQLQNYFTSYKCIILLLCNHFK